MKTFRETLDKINENGISVWKAMIATDVDTYDYETEERFEIICSWCYEYIMNSDETNVSELVDKIFAGLNSGELTIEMLKNNDIACESFVENYVY